MKKIHRELLISKLRNVTQYFEGTFEDCVDQFQRPIIPELLHAINILENNDDLSLLQQYEIATIIKRHVTIYIDFYNRFHWARSNPFFYSLISTMIVIGVVLSRYLDSLREILEKILFDYPHLRKEVADWFVNRLELYNDLLSLE